MRRIPIALVVVAALIVMAAFTLIGPKVDTTSDAAIPQRAAAEAPEPTLPSALEHTGNGVELATPLDPALEVRSPRAGVRPVEQVGDAPKPFSTRRMSYGSGRIIADEALDMREPALAWCAIVGIAEEKRKDVADLVVRTQHKWVSLCRSAGSAQSVNALELSGLREWRRDELGRIVGFELGDALIAGIKAKQGF